MKITDLKMEVIHIPMKHTFKVAFAEIDESTSVIVKISTDEGICGYGEAAPFAPVTGENVEGVMAALKVFRQGLVGMDPMDIEGIHTMMDKVMAHNTSAKCAVDIAVYDILGKAMGQPLYKVLGGSCGTVENDFTIGIDTPENMVKESLEYVNAGFRILKVKAGINPEEDLRALAMIREAIGPNIRLRVDANQGYDVPTAVDILQKMVPIGIEAVEQCLPYWDVEGSAWIKDHVNGIKIMVDESLHSPHDAFDICKRGAADIMNIKLMKCGGLYPALKINAIGEVAGVTCMVGCMLETKVAITAGISLVAARNNITEADCDSFLYSKDPEMGMPGGFTFTGSSFTLSEKPGLGLELDF